MDILQKNVMMKIMFIMMDAIIIANWNVNHYQYARVVLIIDVNYVLLDNCYLRQKYVIQYVLPYKGC